MLQIALIMLWYRYRGSSHPPSKTDIAIALSLAILVFASPLFLFFSKYIKRVLRISSYSLKKNSPAKYEYAARLIHNRFSFFRALTIQEQKLFLKRVFVIGSNKTFAAREGLELTSDMEILIAATQAVLTFGLDDFVLEKYPCYHIFPDRFYSDILKADVHGLTYRKTHIMLSWKAFESGWANDKDKLNLGLHEMAHAVHSEFYEEDLYQEFNAWEQVALPEFNKMRNHGHKSFLREYAANNMHEFWAVCVEHFFEAPLEFRDKLPELYRCMCTILKQDMALRLSGYSTNYVPSPNMAK